MLKETKTGFSLERKHSTAANIISYITAKSWANSRGDIRFIVTLLKFELMDWGKERRVGTDERSLKVMGWLETRPAYRSYTDNKRRQQKQTSVQ